MKRLISGILCLMIIFPFFQLSGFASVYKTKALNLTIYNNGKAFITETRQMEIRVSNKPFEVVFSGIPETIEPSSIQVTSTSPGFKVLAQSYEYDLINTKNLLNRYVGKEIMVVMPDFNAGSNKYVVRHAILVANNDRPVFMLGKRIYIGSYNGIMLPNMPRNLHSRPALVWLLKNNGPEKQQDIKISYIANGFGWRADYSLRIAEDNKSAFLSCWFNVTNNTGMSFNNAHLRLIAGKIHCVNDGGRYKERSLFLAAKGASGKEAIKEKGIFEYHMYSIHRHVTLKARQTKQISFIQSRAFSVKKILKIRNKRLGLYRFSYIGPVMRQHPDVYVVFKNVRQNGLGMPLPGGIVRVYRDSNEGTLFIGEDRIKHTPANAEVLLNLGSSFDVTVERKRINIKKLRKNIYETDWEITIKNVKEVGEEVIIEEYIPGDWKFVVNPDDFKKVASNWIRKKVFVPANSKKKVRYRVRCDLFKP